MARFDHEDIEAMWNRLQFVLPERLAPNSLQRERVRNALFVALSFQEYLAGDPEEPPHPRGHSALKIVKAKHLNGIVEQIVVGIALGEADCLDNFLDGKPRQLP